MSNMYAPAARVNLSSSFLTRSRCKHCGKFPTIYYYVRNPVLWNNPRQITEWFWNRRKFYSRMCSDFYLNDDPKSFTSIYYFSWKLPGGSYDPKLHHTRGVHPVVHNTELLACECGASVWAFNTKSSLSRIEILLRKSKYKYPYKFTVG